MGSDAENVASAPGVSSFFSEREKTEISLRLFRRRTSFVSFMELHYSGKKREKRMRVTLRNTKEVREIDEIDREREMEMIMLIFWSDRFFFLGERLKTRKN